MPEASREAGTLRLWRVFPWDVTAKPGQPYSPQFIPPRQGSGRFDLDARPLVLNLAESAAHAAGEKLQRYRGQSIDRPELREFGHPLAVVQINIGLRDRRIADLCDPEELVRYGVRPDALMSRDLALTQGLSRKLHDADVTGFRLWSALTGDWHATVLFMDRVDDGWALHFGEPRELALDSPELLEMARVLAISVAGTGDENEILR